MADSAQTENRKRSLVVNPNTLKIKLRSSSASSCSNVSQEQRYHTWGEFRRMHAMQVRRELKLPELIPLLLLPAALLCLIPTRATEVMTQLCHVESISIDDHHSFFVSCMLITWYTHAGKARLRATITQLMISLEYVASLVRCQLGACPHHV